MVLGSFRGLDKSGFARVDKLSKLIAAISVCVITDAIILKSSPLSNNSQVLIGGWNDKMFSEEAGAFASKI